MGSPPQVRGKHRSRAEKRDVYGITPAGAGKTTWHTFSHTSPADHPRRCGENRCQRQPIIEYIGSPPQVRGKLFKGVSLLYVLRITPAGAGKTIFHQSFQRHIRDHPRRCGENRKLFNKICADKGSPPQVRGKPIPKYVKASLIRITPAGAGKTRLPHRINFVGRDHPRRCGENVATTTTICPAAGSPPQVRGKLPADLNQNAVNRITPAGAGKTVQVVRCKDCVQDHPRRCGENSLTRSARPSPMGSPPRMRGKPKAQI